MSDAFNLPPLEIEEYSLSNGLRVVLNRDEAVPVVAVPEHPDWGWRTDVLQSQNGFRYVMFNVTPEGAEQIAVETDFARI